MPRPATYDELMQITRALLRLNARAMIEIEAIKTVLMDRDQAAAPELATALIKATKSWQPLLDSVAETVPDSLEDILRKFAGPPQ